MIRGEAQVATECQAIQENLTEHGGGFEHLDEAQRRLELVQCFLAQAEVSVAQAHHAADRRLDLGNGVESHVLFGQHVNRFADGCMGRYRRPSIAKLLRQQLPRIGRQPQSRRRRPQGAGRPRLRPRLDRRRW